MTDLQFTPDGRLKHLITLDGVPKAELEVLIDTAAALRQTALRPVNKLPTLRGRTVVNLFFEPSTRTRTSFELAAVRLSADVVNFDVGQSSTKKGESLIDTLHTLEAMRCDLFVVRHKENGTPALLASHAQPGVAIVNGGDGNHAHPTQGLLDAFTIHRHKGDDFSRLGVAIIGDILHSRVARSDIHALRTLGVTDLRFAAPAQLLTPELRDVGRVFDNIDDAIDGADVVMMLRPQKERMDAAMIADDAAYHVAWGLTEQRLSRARPDAIVMHPGPMNREVEIAGSVADGPRSVILEQVGNGVAMRMAVMSRLLSA